MRIGLVVDATCDLPPGYVAAHRITVLPSRVLADGVTYIDARDQGETQRFLDQQLGWRARDAHSESYSIEEIQKLFLDRLVIEYDCVFCLTVTATRSPIHDHASRASFNVLGHYHDARQSAGREGQFLVRVIDTQSAFAGSALVAAEAARLIEMGKGASLIRERLEEVSNQTWAYLIPRDLRHLRARLHKRGDRSVSLLAATLGSMLRITPILRGSRGKTRSVGRVRGFDCGARALFQHVAEHVGNGLLTPCVCVSYGGTLEQLHQLPGHARLREACQTAGVTLLEGPMSITGMVNVGEGALSISFAYPEEPAPFIAMEAPIATPPA